MMKKDRVRNGKKIKGRERNQRKRKMEKSYEVITRQRIPWHPAPAFFGAVRPFLRWLHYRPSLRGTVYQLSECPEEGEKVADENKENKKSKSGTENPWVWSLSIELSLYI